MCSLPVSGGDAGGLVECMGGAMTGLTAGCIPTVALGEPPLSVPVGGASGRASLRGIAGCPAGDDDPRGTVMLPPGVSMPTGGSGMFTDSSVVMGD